MHLFIISKIEILRCYVVKLGSVSVASDLRCMLPQTLVVVQMMCRTARDGKDSTEIQVDDADDDAGPARGLALFCQVACRRCGCVFASVNVRAGLDIGSGLPAASWVRQSATGRQPREQ